MQTTLLRSGTFVWLTFLTLFVHASSFSQTGGDTLRLSVATAEGIFLQKNLALLSSHYNIDINKALVQQAKVWDNPVLNTDQTLYDGKFFRHGTVNGQSYGEIFAQVQQLIRTAGKIKKQTRLAQDNVEGAQAQFDDLLRNLKFTLTTDLNDLAFLQQTALLYQQQIANMEFLSHGMDEMLKTGDVSQKDNLRIKSLLFSLTADYNENLRNQIELQKELGVLLQLKDSVWIVADMQTVLTSEEVSNLLFQSLKDSAFINRPDLKLAENQVLFQQHNLELQKALVYPDLTVGLQYDRLNSYVPRYWGLDVSIPLPVFNRNKGNIKAAGLAIKQSAAGMEQLKVQVDHETMSAYQKLLNTTRLLDQNNSLFQSSYENLMKNMMNSYHERKVSLIEFTDFFDSYRETRLKQFQLINDQRNAAAELNYTINQNIIKL